MNTRPTFAARAFAALLLCGALGAQASNAMAEALSGLNPPDLED